VAGFCNLADFRKTSGDTFVEGIGAGRRLKTRPADYSRLVSTSGFRANSRNTADEFLTFCLDFQFWRARQNRIRPTALSVTCRLPVFTRNFRKTAGGILRHSLDSRLSRKTSGARQADCSRFLSRPPLPTQTSGNRTKNPGSGPRALSLACRNRRSRATSGTRPADCSRFVSTSCFRAEFRKPD
jgi:hypothetical protein